MVLVVLVLDVGGADVLADDDPDIDVVVDAEVTDVTAGDDVDVNAGVDGGADVGGEAVCVLSFISWKSFRSFTGFSEFHQFLQYSCVFTTASQSSSILIGRALQAIEFVCVSSTRLIFFVRSSTKFSTSAMAFLFSVMVFTTATRSFVTDT